MFSDFVSSKNCVNNPANNGGRDGSHETLDNIEKQKKYN